jgi:hypothetical protein
LRGHLGRPSAAALRAVLADDLDRRRREASQGEDPGGVGRLSALAIGEGSIEDVLLAWRAESRAVPAILSMLTRIQFQQWPIPHMP